MTNGRSEPTSTSPIASIARRSFSQFATKLEKSWSKAQWITAYDFAAPLRRLSKIFKIAAMHLCPGSCKRGGTRLRPRQSKHLVARIDKFGNKGGTDKAGSVGKIATPKKLSLVSVEEQTACSLPMRGYPRACPLLNGRHYTQDLPRKSAFLAQSSKDGINLLSRCFPTHGLVHRSDFSQVKSSGVSREPIFSPKPCSKHQRSTPVEHFA